MEVNFKRVVLITAIAPLIWGSNYYVTRNFLPSEYPIYGASIRALPAGLILLAYVRELPKGEWWMKTLVVSTLTISGFFTLVYIAGSRLPSSVASMVMALSPLTTMWSARLLIGEKITRHRMAGGILGMGGIVLLLGFSSTNFDLLGVLAAAGGMVSSALGFVLTRKWKPTANATTFTAWQLTAGGLILAPIARLIEGPLPSLDTSSYVAFCYTIIFSSIIAYIAWFKGVTTLPAGTVSIIGLLNPLAGTFLGIFFANEKFTMLQACGAIIVIIGIYLGTTVKKKGLQNNE